MAKDGNAEFDVTDSQEMPPGFGDDPVMTADDDGGDETAAVADSLNVGPTRGDADAAAGGDTGKDDGADDAVAAGGEEESPNDDHALVVAHAVALGYPQAQAEAMDVDALRAAVQIAHARFGGSNDPGPGQPLAPEPVRSPATQQQQTDDPRAQPADPPPPPAGATGGTTYEPTHISDEDYPEVAAEFKGLDASLRQYVDQQLSRVTGQLQPLMAAENSRTEAAVYQAIADLGDPELYGQNPRDPKVKDAVDATINAMIGVQRAIGSMDPAQLPPGYDVAALRDWSKLARLGHLLAHGDRTAKQIAQRTSAASQKRGRQSLARPAPRQRQTGDGDGGKTAATKKIEKLFDQKGIKY